MTPGETDRLIRRFLDGELDGDEEREALRRMADDPEARGLLRFDLGFRRLLAEHPAETAPADFADRVMGRIASDERAESPATAGEDDRPGRLGALWGELRRPRTLEWQAAHALLAAAALVLAASAVIAFGGIAAGPGALLTLRQEPDPAPEPVAAESSGPEAALVAPRSDTVLVRFVLEEADARSVAVAGDFSGWEPVPLVPHSRDGEPIWTGVLAIPRGEHRYMFVIDGERWVTDPRASAYSDDGFGNRNALLSL